MFELFIFSNLFFLLVCLLALSWKDKKINLVIDLYESTERELDQVRKFYSSMLIGMERRVRNHEKRMDEQADRHERNFDEMGRIFNSIIKDITRLENKSVKK